MNEARAVLRVYGSEDSTFPDLEARSSLIAVEHRFICHAFFPGE